MKFLRKINLEINKDIYDPIKVKQNDTARYLLFNLLDNRVPFSLENKTVRVYGVKPDGTKVFNNLTIVDANRGLAELQLTTQMLIRPGCLKLELVIYEATDILSTTKFDIDIISCLRDDEAIESTNEFSALTLGLSKLDEWDKYFKETSGAIEEKYTERLNGIDSSLEETKTQKVDKISGKGLSTNDYDNNEKSEVAKVRNKADINYVDTKIATISSGTPLFASSVAGMTNTTRNYVNTTDGYLYTYNGSTFVKSTVKYQSTGIGDDSVGLNNLKSDLSENLQEYKKLGIEEQSGYLNKGSGSVVEDSNYKFCFISCQKGDKFKISGKLGGGARALIIFYNNDTYLGSENNTIGVNGQEKVFIDYELTIGENVNKIGISAKNNTLSITKKVVISIPTIKADVTKIKENFNEVQEIIEKSLDYVKVEDLEVVEGIYYKEGVYAPQFTDYSSTIIKVKSGDKLKINATISGGATALLVLFNESNYVGYVNAGINSETIKYEDYEYLVPEQVNKIIISSKKDKEVSVFKYEIINISNEIKLIKENVSYQKKSFWKDKKIVWFGTSIPEGKVNGFSYPTLTGKILGANVINESVGSSIARLGFKNSITQTDNYGWTGVAYQNVWYAMGASIAEKRDLINNWESKWSALVGGNFEGDVADGTSGDKPRVLSETQKSKILSCSYENKLDKYLSLSNFPDLFVFDHGHNDIRRAYPDDDFVYDDKNPYDRTTFYGAMNFYIKRILEFNPRAKIVIISHYENQLKPTVCEAQKIISQKWNVPFYELYKHLAWSQNRITSSGYWSSDGIWLNDGGESKEITVLNTWLQDNLHPHSDRSGEAINLIAENISSWLDNCIR